MVRSVLAAATLFSLAGLVAAQKGYGRFPCTIVNGDGTFSPDSTQCAPDRLVNPGADNDDTGNQGDRTTPTDPVCTKEIETGAYFCGIAGATCSTSANCDNGVCVDGVCQGGFTQGCASTDSNCSGFLYCLSGEFATTASDTCGGLGAFCQDATQGSTTFTDAQNYAIFNQFCSSGYCSFGNGMCDTHATTVGADCSSDPEFKCTQTSTGQALTCDKSTLTCALAAVPSGRARERRNVAKRNVCPASHEACSVEGGFECVDTTSNIEQCGACAGAGGVDCTQIEGAGSVACVAGTCEIWSCAEGFTWSADNESCVAN
ncbi:uncharacterized protein JCM15063_004330 [Sporobolomyces koalae]|uniref:uncharacterized protein n=1 Tax=Sporobolomyces koalae TaxID=500713 RepID=UPI00316B96D3